MNKKIVVMESVYERNEKEARFFETILANKKIFCVNVLGSPGVGKTTCLINIIKKIDEPCYVIEGDIESEIDTLKLREHGISATQINTGGECHLDAATVKKSFLNAAEFADWGCGGGFLFIENIGNLVCPAGFWLGENVKMLVCSVTDGSDKPYKYPLAFEKSDVVLINKTDLKNYVDFDYDYFCDGVKKLNTSAAVFDVSGKNGTGFKKVAKWLLNKAVPCEG